MNRPPNVRTPNCCALGPSTGHSDARPSTPRGEMLVLPPLPVPKTELHPQLVSRMSDDALSCAAYETLYLAVLAGSAAPPAAAADALQAVRARLNLTKRQEKRLLPLLRPAGWHSGIPADFLRGAEAVASPAYRGLLLLHASNRHTPSGPPSSYVYWAARTAALYARRHGYAYAFFDTTAALLELGRGATRQFPAEWGVATVLAQCTWLWAARPAHQATLVEMEPYISAAMAAPPRAAPGSVTRRSGTARA